MQQWRQNVALVDKLTSIYTYTHVYIFVEQKNDIKAKLLVQNNPEKKNF